MIDIAREVSRVRVPVLAVSALAWGALAAGLVKHVSAAGMYCSATGSVAATITSSLSTWLALNPPSGLATGWVLMLAAMMSPLIVPDIHHIRFTSLQRRRARSIALFVAGYGCVWMACGAVLTGVAFAATALMPQPHPLLAGFGLIALVWQASPYKRVCLNKCHEKPPLRAFGLEADFDALRFGWTHGVWCAGSCSGLMLFPMLLPEGHLAAMAAVATLIYCERIEDPEPPKWKLRGLGKAGRIIAARLRIRLRLLRRVQVMASAKP